MPALAVPTKYDLMNLGGGLVLGIPPTHIRDHEFFLYQNFYPFGTKAVVRPGTTRLSTIPYPEEITTVATYFPQTPVGALGVGQWHLIVGGLTSLAKFNPATGGFTPLTILSNLPGSPGLGRRGAPGNYNSVQFPWIIKQYQGIGYAARRNTGTLKRFDSQFIADAGIAAPVVAPTLADGGAGGGLAAGSFNAVYTYFNRNTRQESNPSPASNTVTLATGHFVNWSALVPSPNPQVTSYRLYRSLPNLLGTYYLVAQIEGNVATVFNNDGLSVNQQGLPAVFTNGLPPSGNPTQYLLEIWNNRGWISDGVNLFYSELGLIESYQASSLIDVYPDDGSSIRALHGHGQALIVGKTNAIHYITGTDATDFQVQTLSDRHGCCAYFTMKSAEGFLFWFGGDDFYRSDMNTVSGIGITKIRTLLDNIDPQGFEYAVSFVYPRLGWYVTMIPVISDPIPGSPTLPTIAVVYNYQTDTWCTFDYDVPNQGLLTPAPFNISSGGSPFHVQDAFDANFEFAIYAAFGNGHVYQLMQAPSAFPGNTDDGQPILCFLNTKQFGSSENVNPYFPVAQHQNAFARTMRRFGVLCAASTPNLTIDLTPLPDSGGLNFLENSPAPPTRTVLLSTPRPWAVYNLPSEQMKASTMGWLLSYQGLEQIEIDALFFEGDYFETPPVLPI